MAMIAPAKQSQTEFKLVPTGTHIARIYQLIDLGVHTTNFKDKNGNNKDIQKIMLVLEIPAQKLDDGSPMTILKEFSFGMGTHDKKSNLRKFIEESSGKILSKEEAMNFDVETLIGQVMMISVAHVPGVKDPTKKYANVTSAMPVMSGIPIPDSVNKTLIFSTASFDKEVFDLLPEWIQKKIALSPGTDLGASANDENQDASKLLA